MSDLHDRFAAAPPVVAPQPLTARPGLDAARDAAVLCPLPRCAIAAFDGPDAATFLQNQLSNDVRSLGPECCQYTSYNTPKGRMLANFVLWCAAPGSFRALVPSELVASLATRLQRFVLRSKVAIGAPATDTAVVGGVGGPLAAAALREALGAAPPPFGVAKAGDATVLALPGPRFVVVAPAVAAEDLRARLALHIPTADFAVWRWLTIAAGVPVVTAATEDLFVPQALNWDLLGGVSFHKGCYPGQEIVARTRYLGRLKERLFGLEAEVDAVPGTRLFGSVFGDQPCGTVVNAAPAPAGGFALLAVVQIAAVEARDLRLGAVDGPRLELRALPYALPAAPEPRR